MTTRSTQLFHIRLDVGGGQTIYTCPGIIRVIWKQLTVWTESPARAAGCSLGVLHNGLYIEMFNYETLDILQPEYRDLWVVLLPGDIIGASVVGGAVLLSGSGAELPA